MFEKKKKRQLDEDEEDEREEGEEDEEEEEYRGERKQKIKPKINTSSDLSKQELLTLTQYHLGRSIELFEIFKGL